MDYQFPQQLFPTFYGCGPPASSKQHCAGNWGSYDSVISQGGSGPLSSWTFTSKHRIRGPTWCHNEPAPIPLLSPRNSALWPMEPPSELDFIEHMQNFFIDNHQDAFGYIGEAFRENLDRQPMIRKSDVRHWQNLTRIYRLAENRSFRINPKAYYFPTLEKYGVLLSDVVHSVSPQLLGDLLYKELREQKDHMLFSEGATGGALAFVPFSHSPECGSLIYPRNPGLDCLNFHPVELQHHTGGSPCLYAKGSGDVVRFQLKGPIRQISSASLLNQSCVAVRSDYFCGVWGLNEANEAHLHQVISTKEIATCVSVSPHVLGEVLVASESGTAHLWTVGRGTQKVREEHSNLYFNAKSSWRWCEFSAHPRVMVYADRTGVEFTDIRVSPAACHTLFHISKTPECRKGERLILSKYLKEAHSFHHLVTTQYSAYIMDERFPGVPMLKWDHMAQSPPMFCHVTPGSPSSSEADAGTIKVLLGSQRSQEITLLQYTGGRADACSSLGPPQTLLKARDSLKHLPLQTPHCLETVTKRLSSSAAGLTSIQMKVEGRGERLCVLQLTEAGDIFYQIIESKQPSISSTPTAEDEVVQQSLKEAQQIETHQTESHSDSSEISSDEDLFGPHQAPPAEKLVPGTTKRIQRGAGIYTDTSSEDSESEEAQRLGREGLKKRKLKQMNLQVFCNDDPVPDTMNGFDGGDSDGVPIINTDETSVNSRSSGHVQTEVQLSDGALNTWKRWLKKMIKKSCKEKPQAHQLKNFEIQADHVFPLVVRDCEKEKFENLRRDLRACMSKHSLLVHTSVSDSITAPDVVPLSKTVVTDAWKDQLSQRLTLSWQGEEAWRAWWRDKLGLNRDQRIDALKRKRRKAKEAKRASGRHLELTGSFTSSVSYQSELSDLSDFPDWISATSQEPCSEAESTWSQPEGFSESQVIRRATSFDSQIDNVAPLTPESLQSRPDEQQTPSRSRTSSLTSGPMPTQSSLRKNKRPAEDVLSSLVEPSQPDIFASDSMARPASPPVAASSQRRSSLPFSQRSLEMDLSQDSLVWSMSQPSTQGSQGRPRLLKSSQPKKKSRMGF